MSNFSRMASYYDALAAIVFLGRIKQSQRYFFNEINAHTHVLILGGGTGWILEEIDQLNIPCTVTYVDSAPAMIKKAKARKLNTAVSVHFITGSYDNLCIDDTVDVLITNFFLDVFPSRELDTVFKSLISTLKPEGKWLCADFVQPTSVWQRVLLKLMYRFFKYTAMLKNQSLPDYESLFRAHGFRELRHKTFFKGMIKSTVYGCKMF